VCVCVCVCVFYYKVLLKHLLFPLSLLTVLMVTPVASLCHLLFGATQDINMISIGELHDWLALVCN